MTEKLKTDGVTRYFWDLSTKGNLKAALTREMLDYKIKHVVAPTDRGYFSVFLYCNEFEYRIMRDYVSDLESEDLKFISCRRLKNEDVALYCKFPQFSQPFKNEIIEYNLRENA